MNGIEYTSVSVSHRFVQSAERVFDAWLDPVHAASWLFATPDGDMHTVEIDARVGGRFRIIDRRKGEDWEHCGEYLEIERPRRLSFTFYLPMFVEQYGSSVVRIMITALPEGGCELSLTQEHMPAEFAEQSRSGWTIMLTKLAVCLEEAAGSGI